MFITPYSVEMVRDSQSDGVNKNYYPFSVIKIIFVVKIGYKNNRLRKQLCSATEIKKTFGVNADRVSRRLIQIEAAPNLEVLQQIPAANCHALKGNRAGEWAVDISANHRMIFIIDHDPVPENDDGSVNTILVTAICIIETTDYH
jgi:plasmid maintenance system killer protein